MSYIKTGSPYFDFESHNMRGNIKALYTPQVNLDYAIIMGFIGSHTAHVLLVPGARANSKATQNFKNQILKLLKLKICKYNLFT